MLTTGEQLRAARAMLRLEQRDLAERGGISPQTVQRLERVRGRFTDVRLGTLNALAAVFAGQGVTFGDGDRPSVAVELARVGGAPPCPPASRRRDGRPPLVCVS